MHDYDKYYNILNLSKEATLNDIKKAYRQLSIKHHPDKNNNCDNEQFNKINDAYTQLTSMAKAAVESTKGITFEQAFAGAVNSNPDLYNQYLTEKGAK